MDKKFNQEEEFTMIAKGICFGAGAGLILGIFLSSPGLTITLGAVLGVIGAEIIRMIAYLKYKKLITSLKKNDASL